jgi:hypothetical protein
MANEVLRNDPSLYGRTLVVVLFRPGDQENEKARV